MDFILNYYLIIAVILTGLTFLLVKYGEKRSAKRTKEEITRATDSIVKEAVQKTVEELKTSTDTLLLKTDGAVDTIIQQAQDLADKTSNQIELLEVATQKLGNHLEYQEVLVRTKYSFHHKNAIANDKRHIFFNILMYLLTNDNYYSLRIKSPEGSIVQFVSDNNTFIWISDEVDPNVGELKDYFFNAGTYLYGAEESNPQVVHVNYLLNALRLEFGVNEIEIGDTLEFSLRKLQPTRRYATFIPSSSRIDKLRKENPSFDNFSSFSGLDGDPKVEVRLIFKFRNGKEVLCKVFNQSPSGTNMEYGITIKAKIVEIIDSE
ncbi:hypothetical protein [Ulvibacterium marinum]|nr:hypothetical protein [Ulvibacterium marinum]